jgi:hypothetical protein
MLKDTLAEKPVTFRSHHDQQGKIYCRKTLGNLYLNFSKENDS